MGPKDVRIRIDIVGICGSDVHYYRYGRIGPFVVEEPMILGREGAGVVLKCGAEVTHCRCCWPVLSAKPGASGLARAAFLIREHRLDAG